MSAPLSGQRYVQACLVKALKASGGNKTRAIQQVMAWARQDMELLQGLTKAHLNGIVAYHVDRIAGGQGMEAPRPAPGKATAKPAARPQRQMVKPAQGSPFGQQILRAASSGNAAMFGMEGYQSPTKPPEDGQKTSQRHIDALMHIASFAGKNTVQS